MKKHIDNHLNPHSSKGRRNVNNVAVINAANLSNTIAAVASGSVDNLATKGTASFLDNTKNHSISPRLTTIVKHELYFPQCYGLPFNQPFPGTDPAQLQNGGNGTSGSEGGSVNNNNSGETSPTEMIVNASDATLPR